MNHASNYKWEVHDLGAHEVLAVFMREKDALLWAQQHSVNGPALQVYRRKER